MNFSCENHQEPELLPVLETLQITQSREVPPPYQSTYTNHYRLRVIEKGNVPVTEYGVIYSTYNTSELENNAPYVIKEPTVLNSPLHIITEEFGPGEKLMSHEKNYPLRTYVYQRAYAKLGDGRVIYGDVVLTAAGKIISLL